MINMQVMLNTMIVQQSINRGNKPNILVFGDEFLTQGLHLKSHQRCSAGIRTCLSADQSSSSTLTESSFLFDTCLIHRGTVMLE